MKIGIVGASGRMGKMLVQEVIKTNGCELSGGIEKIYNVGKDIAQVAGLEPIGIEITNNAEELIKQSDAIIDFTSPEATLEFAKLTAKYNKIHIIGTTGLSNEDEAKLEEYANQTAIVYAGNMSVGINLLLDLVEKTASTIGGSCDIEIVEMHHRHKVDAPSGTALMLGKAAAKGLNVNFDEVKVLSREGVTGERKQGEIGFATLRGGGVVGDHTVMFVSDEERIELTHKASSRVIFADGAVHAALWAEGKKTGLYTMKDVLGFK